MRRKFIRAGSVPPMTLGWSSNRSRPLQVRRWRTAVSLAFSEHPRCLRVAWALEWLFGREGYAFATDGFLSKELSMNVKNVQAALQSLEKGGAIIRASMFIQGRPQRRIWPSAQLIPPTMGNMDTPYESAKVPPTMGRQNTQEGKVTRHTYLSETVLQARRAAQIREQRSIERMRDEGAPAEGPAERRPRTEEEAA